MRLAYGTVQRCGSLDFVAEQLVKGQLRRLEAPVLAALRVGLFQLLYMDGVAEHAAVNETVELVKRASHAGASLVNAVLRRGAREGRVILSQLHEGAPDGAALLHSVPLWLAELWWEELGAETAVALLRAINDPAESAVRINTLVSTVERALADLPVPAHRASGLPEGIVLEAPFDSHGSELFERGAIMPQSRASMVVTRMLDPRPGERVLDLCAAPGAKTTHIAALIENDGSIVAVERHPGRAAALERTCARLDASCVQLEVADARDRRGDGPFDRVLVDPPCSGLGTLQSRPDLRWRASRDAIDELADIQSRILAAAGEATRPGGVLVYSVCTISRAEGEQVLERFLAQHGQFGVEDRVQLLPHRDGTDGFFIARLKRRAG
jgi:16S rRNA (cytosine967-C5)-methyltransferase